MLIAMLPTVFGNHAFVNALSRAWIAFGGLWTFAGLPIMMKKARQAK